MCLDSGASSEWNGYIKGDEWENEVVLGTTKESGEIRGNLGFYPEYFMGDSVTGVWVIPEPCIPVVLADDEGMWVLHEPDELEANCGARIVSYEYDEPIENSFGIDN